MCGHSGIGLEAAKLFATMMGDPIHRLILVCRNDDNAAYAKDQILPLLPKNKNADCYRKNIIPVACDQASLDSVRKFNTVLRKRLDETYNDDRCHRQGECASNNGIDVMCLNAAVLMARDSKAQFTADGLELTFQTNYLAPFLMANLTADLLNPGARVVLSTSGLHSLTKLDMSGLVDPGTGRARRGFEMVDGSSFHYKESYAVSKLCIVMLCAELDRRLRHQSIVVNCFSPGLMTDSGLFRNQQKCGGTREVCQNKQALKNVKPVGWGAGALVFMATAEETGRRSGEYWSDPDSTLGWDSVYGKHFRASTVSDQIDPQTLKQLWTLSCDLAGIPCTENVLRNSS